MSDIRTKRFPVEGHPLRCDAWFAGFADGEGCFYVVDGARQRVGFQLGLRADDTAILERLQEAFGGGVSTAQRGARDTTNASPKRIWTATSIPSLLALVDYFDSFPLRSKKSRDYEIWREAVQVWVSTTRNERRTLLAPLASRLREVRVYA